MSDTEVVKTALPDPETAGREKRALWRILPFFTPYRGLIAGGLGCSLIARVFDLAPAIIIGLVVDAVTQAQSTGQHHPWTFVLFGLAVTGAFAGLAVCQSGGDYLLGLAAQRFRHDLRMRLYEHIQRLDAGYLETRRKGDLMSVISGDVDNLEGIPSDTAGNLARIGIGFLGTYGYLFWLDWRLSLLLAAPLPLVMIVISYFKGRVQPQFRAARQAAGEINSILENNLQGMGVIQAYTAEAEEKVRVDGQSRRNRDFSIAAAAIRARHVPFIYLIAGAAYGLLIAGGGVLVLSPGGPTLGAYASFVVMAVRLIQPVFLLGMLSNQIERADASARRVMELLEREPRVRDAQDALSLPGGRLMNLELREVRFAYPGGLEALEGVSLSLERGRMLGVTGPTGAGKSTLIKLILRHYDPHQGDVLINGSPLARLRLNDYRRRIGYVSQEPFLFFGSVAENIRLGSPAASDEEIIRAAESAGAHEFINRLPDGYDTLVGDRGLKLSGGQRQRISLARAILRDPDLLILDEATSAVDIRTESSIKENLERLRKGRLILAVAHRLSTIRHSDEIVVVSGGRITERGTHDQLMARPGVYREMWLIQQGESGAI